jgi:hypothetical protein
MPRLGASGQQPDIGRNLVGVVKWVKGRRDIRVLEAELKLLIGIPFDLELE